MRAAFLLLLLAALARGEPTLRWLDKTGGVQQVTVAEVVKEDIVEIHVRALGGREHKVPTRHLLLLVREDDRDADQRALLLARLALQNGRIPKGAAPLLDRLAATGKPAWVREYASAARALLAAHGAEKGAAERVEAFARSWPNSRFRAHLRVAEALVAAHGKTKLAEVLRPFDKAQQAVSGSGPLLVRARVMVESAERVLHMQEEMEFRNFVDAIMTGVDEAAKDAPASVINDCTFLWIRTARQRYLRKHIVAHGEKPLGPLVKMQQMLTESSFLLPELRSDMWYELALDHRACGQEKQAKAALEKSLKLATDPYRRARAASR